MCCFRTFCHRYTYAARVAAPAYTTAVAAAPAVGYAVRPAVLGVGYTGLGGLWGGAAGAAGAGASAVQK